MSSETENTNINKEEYSSALIKSKDYFGGDELAAQVFLGKYALTTPNGEILEQDPDAMHHRLAKEFARIEANYDNPMSEDLIYSYLKDFKYVIPQGSPMSGIGNPYQTSSLSNCFAAGTKVHTTKGVRDIQDIEIGDCVVTHENRVKQVSQIHKNKLEGRQLYNFKCYRTPEVKVTGNHKFMSISKEQLKWGMKPQWNEIKYLRAGDYIQVPNNKENGLAIDFDISSLFGEKFEYGNKSYEVERSADQIRLVTVSKSGTRYLHSHFMPSIIKADEDFAYFVGLWYGDGCIFGENTKSKVRNCVRGITFTFGSHEEKLTSFVTTYLSSNAIPFDLNDNDHIDGTTQIVVHSSVLGYAFEQFFGRGFAGKKLHSSMHNWPTNMVKSLAKGLIDSDGTITKQGDVRVVMVNDNFITEVYHLLRSKNQLVGLSRTKQATRLDFGRNNFYRNSSKKTYKDKRTTELLSNKTFHSIEIDGNTFVQILEKSIINDKPEYVYTFGVDDDHSYSVEGLVAMNCFVIESPYDSFGGILKTDQEQAQLMKRRGGVGFDISTIRPKGIKTNNAAKTTDGIGVFMERFSNTCREVAQSGRRGALMLSISIHHPEIQTFINIKRNLKKVTGANISIRLSDEFMNAVKNKQDYQLRFPVDELKNPSISSFVSANEIWNEIIESAHMSAEPGLLFWDTIKRESPADAYPQFKTVSTNPCFSGDTLIATADGRNAVSIKQLAEEGKDVLVYSLNPASGDVEIKTARNPRLTGSDKKLYRVTLNDNSFLDVTSNHEFLLNSGERKQTIELSTGDFLPRFSKKMSSDERYVVIGNAHNNSKMLEDVELKRIEDSTRSGKMFDLIKLASIKMGYSYLDQDKKLVETIKSMTEQGYNSYIVKDKVSVIHVNKICEICQKTFSVPHLQREAAFCSTTCSDQYVSNNKNISLARINAERQERIYSELKLILNRDPLMSEWQNECNKQKISTNCLIGHARTFKNKFGRQVVSVVEIPGNHDVYNLTVDLNHTVSIITDKNNNIFNGVHVPQCGEITLSAYDSCRLLLVNTLSFVKNPFEANASFDYEKYAEIVQASQKLMDDMIDLELECVNAIIAKVKKDPEPEDIKRVEIDLWHKIRQSAIDGRRTGLGVTAIGDTLAALNIRYGSDESIVQIEEIYKHLALNAYRSTVNMAKERGAFPSFDYSLEQDHPFINRIMDLDPELKANWKKHGRRNVALTTTAPAGSVSVLTQTTSGIEPAFEVSYKRRKKINPNDKEARVDFTDAMGDKWQEYKVYHHQYKKWMEVTGKEAIEDSPYFGARANDINWVAKVKAQAAAQKYICHSISNTTNLPADTTIQTVSDIYMTGWASGTKGVTIYRDGCRDGVLVTETPVAKIATEVTFEEHQAPKRPKDLSCDIFHMTVNGEKWNAFIGLYENKPYEIFAGRSEYVHIPKSRKQGVIHKNGTYNLLIGEGDDIITVKDLAKIFENTSESAFTRTISLALRHGVPVQYVVEQIEKGANKENDLFSLGKGLMRVLKSYIKDGTKTKKKCESCGSEDLAYLEGCLSCTSCGNSKCN